MANCTTGKSHNGGGVWMPLLVKMELSRYVQSKNALNMINNDKFSCGVRHQAAFEFNFAHSLYATGDRPPGLTEDILMRL